MHKHTGPHTGCSPLPVWCQMLGLFSPTTCALPCDHVAQGLPGWGHVRGTCLCGFLWVSMVHKHLCLWSRCVHM